MEDAMSHELAVGKPIPHVLGLTVTRCIVDFAFTLHLVKPVEAVREQKEAFLRITTFDCDFDGIRLHFDATKDLAGLGRALTLFGHTILGADIGTDASLVVKFDHQTTLYVPNHEQYEAWNLDGPDQILIVSGPGDKVTVFH
jgi:hypothetical protein